MQNKGFTIIELVVAIFVLTLGIIGIYSAFSVMAVATSQMSERFIASYLAQEGMELVRNMRDNNWINDRDWTAGFDLCYLEPGCQADYKTETLTPYTKGSYLDIDGEETRFSRKITINQIDDHTLQVKTEVFWPEKATILFNAGQNSIIAEEYLYNWY